MKFVQKPGIINGERAAQLIYWFNFEPENIPTWFQDALDAGGIVIGKQVMAIDTIFGRKTAGQNHVILGDNQGNILPISLLLFEIMYEESI